MAVARVQFDRVWKKFARGERKDSLRDLVTTAGRRLLSRAPSSDLGEHEFWALKDVSFELGPGEALGVIGVNGAGKSTTLKLLTGILKPTRGRACLSGRAGALIEVAAGFHQDLTGRENVFLQGAIMGLKRREILRHFDDIVAFAGVESFIDTPVKRYSTGMSARLGFAIATCLEPAILLIDEVLAVGDFTFQQRCYERLEQFRKAGVAIVFVSHNLQAVAALADRVLVLRPGADAVLTDVHAALRLHSAPTVAADESRATLRKAILLDERSGSAPDTIRPGQSLRLEAQLDIGAALPRCCVNFQLVRHDGLIVFDGGAALDGVAPVAAEVGASIETAVVFGANVLRGVYSINLYLIDNERVWRPVWFYRVASFSVEETTRIAGVAELSPVYTVVLHSVPTAYRSATLAAQ